MKRLIAIISAVIILVGSYFLVEWNTVIGFYIFLVAFFTWVFTFTFLGFDNIEKHLDI